MANGVLPIMVKEDLEGAPAKRDVRQPLGTSYPLKCERRPEHPAAANICCE
jgi:hypothetical protein